MLSSGNVLGIDPDTQTTAWAVLDRDSCLLAGGVLRIPPRLKGHEAILETIQQINGFHPGYPFDVAVVETQQYRDKGSKVRVSNLLGLALVSGAAAARFLSSHHKVVLADPAVWTRGWDKKTRHNRLREMYYGVDDQELARLCGMNRRDAVHVWDAIDLARWYLGQRH